VVGFNCADEEPLLRKFLEEEDVTFPNIRDNTPAGWDLFENEYQRSDETGITAVPLNYIINREGVVVDSRYGFNEEEMRESLRTQWSTQSSLRNACTAEALGVNGANRRRREAKYAHRAGIVTTAVAPVW